MMGSEQVEYINYMNYMKPTVCLILAAIENTKINVVTAGHFARAS